MAVGIKPNETVQHRFPIPYAFPRTCDESPGLFATCLLPYYFFFDALTRKTDEIGFEKRLFLFKNQVILWIEKKQGYIHYTFLDYVQISDWLLSVHLYTEKNFSKNTWASLWHYIDGTSVRIKLFLWVEFDLSQLLLFCSFIVFHWSGTHYRYICEIQVWAYMYSKDDWKFIWKNNQMQILST